MTSSGTQSLSINADIAVPLLKRTLFKRGVVLLGLGLATTGVTFAFQMQRGEAVLPGLVPALIVLTLVVGVMVFSLWRVYTRELEALASYRLDLGERSLRRVVTGVADAELGREQVTKITTLPTGLMVLGGGRSVFIPSSLERFDEVEQALSAWSAPAPQDGRKAAAQSGLGVVSGLVCVAAWVGSGQLADDRARWAATVVLYVLIGVILYTMLSNPDVPARMKRSIVVVCVIMGLGPIARHLLSMGAP